MSSGRARGGYAPSLLVRPLVWTQGWADRDEGDVSMANRPTAPGLGPEHVVLQRRRGHARRRDLLEVSKNRPDFVAVLAVSETTPRGRALRVVPRRALNCRCNLCPDAPGGDRRHARSDPRRRAGEVCVARQEDAAERMGSRLGLDFAPLSYAATTGSLTTGKTLAYVGPAGSSSSLLIAMNSSPTSPVHRLPCSAAARSFVFEGPDIVAG